MPKLPFLNPGPTRRVMTDGFRGYNHHLRLQDGEMYDTTNLSTEHYPLLATRKKRGTVRQQIGIPAGGMIAKDRLYFVAGGKLYSYSAATGEATEAGLSGLSGSEKQMVSMGAYICIFPDKKYFNTADPTDCGDMELSYTTTEYVAIGPCNADGESYPSLQELGYEPTNPVNGMVWIDVNAGRVLRQWSDAENCWVTIPTTYTRIRFSSKGVIPTKVCQFDGVTISGDFGPTRDGLNGLHQIVAVGGRAAEGGDAGESDYIVFPTDRAYTGNFTTTISLSMPLPDLDFVCECQNRLWGCRYGQNDGTLVNEIYACALGDFRNWNQYQGLSTDSWTASVGSDGPWTGAVNYLGHPTFFKEDRIHIVTVSATGAHRIDETVARGVQEGSHRSLQVVGETLYYKSRSDVCAWQGGFPASISDALGEERYSGAVAGVIGNRYYISMQNEQAAWDLFVYDTKRGLWIREDATHVAAFSAMGGELYAVTAEGTLLALNGTTGTAEGDLSWAMETGILYYEYPDKKYVSRYDFRLSMEDGATATVWMEYDSSGVWIESGTIQKTGTGTAVVPIRPRRCDHLRMKLTGTKGVKIFSIARTLEVGSDA